MFFNSAPQARTSVRSNPRSIVCGAYPRERRSIRGRCSNVRATESSTRMQIPRLWNRNQSATPLNRLHASSFEVIMGSSLILPLVITNAVNSGAPSGRSANNRKCSGVYASITPTVLFPGATSSARFGPTCRGRMTIGRCKLTNSSRSAALTLQIFSTLAKSRAINANGLSLRFFRHRKS